MNARRPSRPLRPEERDIWGRVARTVKPIEAPRPDEAPSRPEPSSGSSRAAQEGEASREMFSQYLDPRAPVPERTGKPAERDREKKVRRGKLEVEARFDLHGHTEASGRRALLNFLHRSRDRGAKTVLVITGKGASSRALDERRFEPWNPDGKRLPGVLKRAFPRWMGEAEFAAIVSGYAGAHARHGGSGAYYVMLRG